jgi:hypothetical protein
MKPYAWINVNDEYKILFDDELPTYYPEAWMPLYTHPAKTLTDDDIAKVVHELNQKARTPERWVTAMEIGAETIIQLRDELAILRKAQE